MVDRELELVAPHARYVEAMMASYGDARPGDIAVEQTFPTRKQWYRFLEEAPLGHENTPRHADRCPTYHFWMRLRQGYGAPAPMAGTISLRIGTGEDLEYYFGHIGYGVYPPARGRHYAERACRLLLPLAQAHGINPLWITTDPANGPSRRTCERLGAELVDIVDIPRDHVLYARGQRKKCRYRIEI